jgi:hypothetical protein
MVIYCDMAVAGMAETTREEGGSIALVLTRAGMPLLAFRWMSWRSEDSYLFQVAKNKIVVGKAYIRH